ncbi:BglG family transcription antiterminator [Clostridium chauvoei]|uniref:BglG family transcription antiterminator n=1 Tax=Clostridium chauvoei TaxID=46867 RepID=UPI001C844E0D|nr:BglG family transcription antiterminator [Clostridium chauvoei]MBX7309898.1 BglG family transcription antiterminator [Clostridium chauvoei]MBX7314885.1 BglG family transcription antiterminator [Clostridium chauvoei]MBX7342894.1 BglG family transcription antiterminator [Clostridium chauvoei]
MLNKRCKDILLMLMEKELYYNIEDLANEFNVSKRTIRYDLDKIDYFLKSNSLTEISRKPNAGVKLSLKDNEKNSINDIFRRIDINNYVLSQEERVVIILYELLTSKSEIKYRVLTEKLMISKSTLVSDLKLVRKWLKGYKLAISTENKNGLIIDGEEKEIRKAMVDLLVNDGGGYNIIEIVDSIYSKENMVIFHTIQKDFFKCEDVKFVESIVRNLEHKKKFSLSDEAFMNLVINILVTVKRNLINRNLDYSDYNLDYINCSEEYGIITEVVGSVEEYFDINISKGEVQYLTIIMQGSSISGKNVLEQPTSYEIEYITNKLIRNVEKVVCKGLRSDYQLYDGVLKHINSLVFRIVYDRQTTNALIDNIKNSYSEIFYVIRQASNFIERKYKKEISDDEIGYLTLYFQAAIERKDRIKESNDKLNLKSKNIDGVKNVIIACYGGFATGRLLSSKIKEMFNVNIVSVTSLHNLSKIILENDVDLVISSIKIKENLSVPSVVVSPLLSCEDIVNLKRYINVSSTIYNVDVVNDILSIIEDRANVNDRMELKKELMKYFNIIDKNSNSLLSNFSINNINLSIEESDWREAIRKSAKPLLEDGVINKAYIDDMVKNIEDLGPYIVVDDGIAIPHAKPGKNVKGFGFTITTFKEPISILNKDGVKVFFTMATENEKDHIDIITQLMKLVEDEDFIELLKVSSNPVKVFQRVREIVS